jgi:methionyl-tRNA formyltransferase
MCGAELLVETVEAIKNGTAPSIPQDESLATYAQKIEKADCLIDFTKDACTVHNQIRGLSPTPLSFTHTPDGKLLKVTQSRVAKVDGENAECGKVISLEGGEISVACGNGVVNLLRVLPEGKGRMSSADFIRGRKIAVGDMLK